MSLFAKDLAAEEILGQFLTAQYEKLNFKPQRIYDKDLQNKGVDVTLTHNHKTYNIDEKAQLHYLNKCLPTFALEISYLKRGELKAGWLYDTHKQTDVYAFVFNIFLINKKEVLSNIDDILSCEVVFVHRNKLIDELAKRKLNFKFCNLQSEILRSQNLDTKLKYSLGFYFRISAQLSEKPVNLIVRRSFLEEIGKTHFFKKE